MCSWLSGNAGAAAVGGGGSSHSTPRPVYLRPAGQGQSLQGGWGRVKPAPYTVVQGCTQGGGSRSQGAIAQVGDAQPTAGQPSAWEARREFLAQYCHSHSHPLGGEVL